MPGTRVPSETQVRWTAGIWHCGPRMKTVSNLHHPSWVTVKLAFRRPTEAHHLKHAGPWYKWVHLSHNNKRTKILKGLHIPDIQKLLINFLVNSDKLFPFILLMCSFHIQILLVELFFWSFEKSYYFVMNYIVVMHCWLHL